MISYKFVERFSNQCPALSLERFAEIATSIPYREPKILEKSTGGFLPAFAPYIHHGMGFVLTIFKTSIRVAPSELVDRHLEKFLQTVTDPITPELKKGYRAEIQQKLDYEVLPKEYEAVVIYLADINEIWIATKSKEALNASYQSVHYALQSGETYLKRATLTLGQIYLRDIFMDRHTPNYKMQRNPKLEINKRIVKADPGMNDEMFESLIGNSNAVVVGITIADQANNITLSLNGKGGIDRVECNVEFKHSWMLQGDPESHTVLHSICAGIWVSALKSLLVTIEKDTESYFQFSDSSEDDLEDDPVFVSSANPL